MSFLEKYAKSNKYICAKVSINELILTIPGAYKDYKIAIFYFSEYDILYFSCDFDVSINDEKFSEISTVVFEINERIWIGHFDRIFDTKKIVFSFSVPKFSSVNFDENYMDEILCNIVFEVDRFYPCFISEELTKDKIRCILDTTVIDVIGNA